MSLICKTFAGSQLNWHRQEKKFCPFTKGSLGALWHEAEVSGWCGVSPFQTLLILKITKKICFARINRERGNNFSRWKITCFELGERQQQTQTDRKVEEGEDIIYTSVTPKPADEKSHRVRPGFDTCCTHPRMLQDIVWLRRLFDQHF